MFPDSPLAKLISWVAIAEDKATFQARSIQAAQEASTYTKPDTLVTFLHNPPKCPAEAAARFEHPLGAWLAACQAAIFEILYNFGEKSLPLVRQFAYGEYDWTQANAIEILCRLATDGIERSKIADEIADELPNWEYEAIMYSLPQLVKFAPIAPPVADALQYLIDEWKDNGDPVDAFQVIWQLSFNAASTVKAHEPFLRDLMHGKGLENRNPLMDGQVIEVDGSLAALSEPTYSSIPDFHSIRAALVLNKLLPDDHESLNYLQRWATEHPDQNIRKELSDYLNKLS